MPAVKAVLRVVGELKFLMKIVISLSPQDLQMFSQNRTFSSSGTDRETILEPTQDLPKKKFRKPISKSLARARQNTKGTNSTADTGALRSCVDGKRLDQSPLSKPEESESTPHAVKQSRLGVNGSGLVCSAHFFIYLKGRATR